MTEISLIKSECANFFDLQEGIKNYCCYSDKSCKLFSNTKARCIYFEEGVLPLRPELQLKYLQARKMSVLNIQKTCNECGETFVGGKKKYCDSCLSNRKKSQRKARMSLNRKIAS